MQNSSTPKGDAACILTNDLFNLHDDQTQPKLRSRLHGGPSSRVLFIFGVLLLLVTAVSLGALTVSIVALRSTQSVGDFAESTTGNDYHSEEADREGLKQVYMTLCIVYCT